MLKHGTKFLLKNGNYVERLPGREVGVVSVDISKKGKKGIAKHAYGEESVRVVFDNTTEVVPIDRISLLSVRVPTPSNFGCGVGKGNQCCAYAYVPISGGVPSCTRFTVEGKIFLKIRDWRIPSSTDPECHLMPLNNLP